MYMCIYLYRRELDIAGYTGNQGQMVTPEECKKVFIEIISENRFTPQLLPHLNISDLLGGIYSATDGSVDPTGLTTAYARGESIEMKWRALMLSHSTRSDVGRGPSFGRLPCHKSAC